MCSEINNQYVYTFNRCSIETIKIYIVFICAPKTAATEYTHNYLTNLYLLIVSKRIERSKRVFWWEKFKLVVGTALSALVVILSRIRASCQWVARLCDVCWYQLDMVVAPLVEAGFASPSKGMDAKPRVIAAEVKNNASVTPKDIHHDRSGQFSKPHIAGKKIFHI